MLVLGFDRDILFGGLYVGSTGLIVVREFDLILIYFKKTNKNKKQTSFR